MYNLLKNYRIELCKELIRLYFKSIVLSEYISIFPNLRNIKFSNDLFPKYIKKIIETNHLGPILAEIANREIFSFTELQELMSTSISDILNKIYSNNSLSFFDNFPNSFPKYQSEPYNYQTDDGYFLNEEKYKYNNFYIEIYFRTIDHPEPVINPTWAQQQIITRSPSLKGVSNPFFFYQFIKQYRDPAYELSDEAFFRLFSDIRIGARLMFNPSITANKSELFQNLFAKESIRNEKINAIKGKHEETQGDFFYFPLKIADIEFTLFTSQYEFIGIRRTLNDLQIFIENNILKSTDDRIFINENSLLPKTITKNLWKNDNFKKLFKYHIPVNAFEILLPQDQLISNKLLNLVYEQNLPYKNLNLKIINLINRVLNAEDPNKI